jgi:hypothetical protein
MALMRAPRHAAIAVMALTASTHGENGGPRYDNNTGERLKPLAKSGNKSLRQQLHRKVFMLAGTAIPIPLAWAE